MQITPDTTVADIATAAPATIRVFQQHQIDFCCGGKVPLRQACAAKDLSTEAVLGDLRTATAPADRGADWSDGAGDGAGPAHPGALPRRTCARNCRASTRCWPRSSTGTAITCPESCCRCSRPSVGLQRDLLAHMLEEDRVLFPMIEALDAGEPLPDGRPRQALAAPIAVMEAEHAGAGAALARMRALTGGYAPPEWACPTFRGLYYGLSQLEADMHLHVHLENHILFPRAVWLASRYRKP